MTKRTTQWIVVLLLAISGSTCWAAEGDAERIQKLEERVQQLETTLRKLVDAQQNQGVVGADLRSAIEETTKSDANREHSEPDMNRAEIHAENEDKNLPQELLPNLGKIGATANFVSSTGLGSNGFLRDHFYGGSLYLPLLNVPGGKLSYEVAIGVLNFDQPSREERRQILELIPFGLRYSPTMRDSNRVRPFVAAGFGNYVVLTSSPSAGAALQVGARVGAGVEWRPLRDVGLAFDVYRNWTNGGINYTTIGPRAAWHF